MLTEMCLDVDTSMGGHTLQLYDYTFTVSFSQLDSYSAVRF